MDTLRKAVTVGLVLLLTVNVAAANAVTAADRTVLNGEFVKSTLEEEGAYQTLRSEATSQVAARLGGTGGGSGVVDRLPVSVEGIVREVITTDYVRTQVEANIDRTYAYLNGRRGELELSVDLTPVKAEVETVLEEELRTLSVGQLLSAAAGNRSLTVEVSNVSFDLRIVGRMARNESAYRAARERFRDDVRTVVLDRAVERAYQRRSDDELLALVIEGYDPTAYTEEEKARLVEENEAEIRAALRERIRTQAGDRLNETVEEQLTTLNERLSAEVESGVRERIGVGGENVSIAGPVADMAGVAIDGLTTDMEYETFRSELNASRADLAANVSALVANRLDQRVPDRIDLTGDLPAQTREQLRTARRVAGTVDLLVFALPTVALGLLGGLWFVTRSVPITAAGGGLASLIAGAASFGVVSRIPDRARRTLGGDDVPLADVVVGFIEQVVAVAAGQSIALIGLGVILVTAGVVLHRRER